MLEWLRTCSGQINTLQCCEIDALITAMKNKCGDGEVLISHCIWAAAGVAKKQKRITYYKMTSPLLENAGMTEETVQNP